MFILSGQEENRDIADGSGLQKLKEYDEVCSYNLEYSQFYSQFVLVSPGIIV